jgi:hypothetical protein
MSQALFIFVQALCFDNSFRTFERTSSIIGLQASTKITFGRAVNSQLRWGHLHVWAVVIAILLEFLMHIKFNIVDCRVTWRWCNCDIFVQLSPLVASFISLGRTKYRCEWWYRLWMSNGNCKNYVDKQKCEHCDTHRKQQHQTSSSNMRVAGGALRKQGGMTFVQKMRSESAPLTQNNVQGKNVIVRNNKKLTDNNRFFNPEPTTNRFLNPFSAPAAASGSHDRSAIPLHMKKKVPLAVRSGNARMLSRSEPVGGMAPWWSPSQVNSFRAKYPPSSWPNHRPRSYLSWYTSSGAANVNSENLIVIFGTTWERFPPRSKESLFTANLFEVEIRTARCIGLSRIFFVFVSTKQVPYSREFNELPSHSAPCMQPRPWVIQARSHPSSPTWWNKHCFRQRCQSKPMQ